MFKVHLRQKKLKNGLASLYLDFSHPIWHEAKGKNTRREFLNLYVHLSPKNKAERDHNREMMQIGEAKQAEILLAIKNDTYGLADHQKQAKDFLSFFKERTEQRKGKTKENWVTVLFHLNNYTEGKLKFNQINKNFLLKFKEYLDSLELAQNSKMLYFSKIKCAVEEANDRGLLRENYGLSVKNFPYKQAPRPFLTDEDLNKLLATPFPHSPTYRRAAFFSILTSLRWSDCIEVTYEQIIYDKSLGYYLDFTIKKPDRPDRVYLNDEVLEWCEYDKGKSGRIFALDEWQRRWAVMWLKLAGVRLIGGFHQFRHTFAMKAINDGERIEVIAAMMGHKKISTTQLYAKILDKNKRDASHRMTLRPKAEE